MRRKKPATSGLSRSLEDMKKVGKEKRFKHKLNMLEPGIIFVALLILLSIETYQDNVMNEIAMEESKKNEEI